MLSILKIIKSFKKRIKPPKNLKGQSLLPPQNRDRRSKKGNKKLI